MRRNSKRPYDTGLYEKMHKKLQQTECISFIFFLRCQSSLPIPSLSYKKRCNSTNLFFSNTLCVYDVITINWGIVHIKVHTIFEAGWISNFTFFAVTILFYVPDFCFALFSFLSIYSHEGFFSIVGIKSSKDFNRSHATCFRRSIKINFILFWCNLDVISEFSAQF